MKAYKLMIILGLTVIILGCTSAGPSASFSERFSDMLGSETLNKDQVKCISVDQTFSYQSGKTNITLPGGVYKGDRENDGGTFYFAPAKILPGGDFVFSTNYAGIYLKDTADQGNLIETQYTEASEYNNARYLRGPILPPVVFTHIKRLNHC